MNNIKGSISTTLAGRYKVGLVDANTNEVVWENPEWKKNLILNQGMDAIASLPYSYVTLYAWAGNGTRQNSILSGGTGASQSGNTITMDQLGTLTHFTQSAGGYLSALEAGDALVYDTGSGIVGTVNVISVSDLTCVVDVSQTVTPAQGFTIWKTSQIGLEGPTIETAGGDGGTYTQPSGSYWLPGYNGAAIAGNVMRLYRTYDFRVETSPITYTEIGVGWSRIHGITSAVFSRILLDTPVSVAAGQRLRVAYELYVSVQPTASIARPNVTITNWPVAPATNTNATESLQTFSTLTLDGISTNGLPNNGASGRPLDPCSSGGNCAGFISTNQTALSSFGSATTRTGDEASCTLAAYPGAGSYYQDKTCTFGLTQANSTALASFGLGYTSTGQAFEASQQAYCLVFQQTQSKSDVQTLSLSWRYTWSRTLSNGSA